MEDIVTIESIPARLEPQYLYMLNTWGGFYNKEHQDKHKEQEGYRWFDKEFDRTDYINKLRSIEDELGAKVLMLTVEEGYHTKTLTTLHRISEYKGKTYYSEDNIGFGYPYDQAAYKMEYKWLPGLNDEIIEETLKEDVDYDKVKVVQEWISGAFEYETS